jgi:hypothetical protein
MVKKFCPSCKKEVDAELIEKVWTPCFGPLFGCPDPDCNVTFWGNNSLAVNEKGEVILHKAGKFFSKNEKGEITPIELEMENT